eukprot:1450681-Rhodomonas_salina.1
MASSSASCSPRTRRTTCKRSSTRVPRTVSVMRRCRGESSVDSRLARQKEEEACGWNSEPRVQADGFAARVGVCTEASSRRGNIP